MADDDEFDERDAVLMVMLGLVSLADDAMGAPPAESWSPPSRRDDEPLLR